jgi:undecaprenyl-diphosphatase
MNQINQNIKSFLGFLKHLLIVHWRSLFLLLIGVYLPLQIFTILAVKIWQQEGTFPGDIPILLAIHSTAQQQLDTLAVILTKLGSFWTALPILSVIAYRLWHNRKWRTLAYLLTTALGNLVINHTAKELMHRIRPHLWESKSPEFDYGFPSGHAMTSMTLITILLALSWHRSWRWLVFAFGSLFIFTIAWTRLYLGVHFPSDIIAGWMVALAWSIGVNFIIKPNFTKVNAVKSITSSESS